jgi:hypothetical protein
VTVNPDNFAPIVANPISDMTVDAGSGDTVMYLSEVFADNFGVAPALDYTAIEIDPVTGAPSAGTGLFQYKFTLYGHDGADASFATTSLTFSGNIQQSTFNWNNVDYPAHEEGTADIFHSPPAFNRHLDTWRYNGWTSIAPGDSNLPPAGFFDPGPQNGEDVIVSAGSGSAVFYEQKDVVQIVAFGDVTWSGEFARQQVSYSTSGTADGNRLTLSVEGNTNPGLLTASMLGSQLTLAYTPGAGSADITIRATDPEGDWVEDTFTVDVTGGASAEVVGRHIFYNNSALDAGGDDDAAIDPVKTPLLPQGAASSDNYTSYSRGINGIMVDIDGLSGAPAISDISVRVNQAAAPDTWSAGPVPESVTVRAGEGVGGSDRVTIVWADGAILNQWVEVTVRATVNTGLAANDVFYLANLVGDCDGNGEVGSSDYGQFAGQFGRRGGIGAMAADLNGDGRVDLADLAIMRGAIGNSVLAPIIPAVAPEAVSAAAAPALQAVVAPIAGAATPMVPVVSQPLDGRDANNANDNLIVTAALAPAVDLLTESLLPAGYISGPQPISVALPAMTLYRAATTEYDLRPLGEGPASDAQGNDLLADVLEEAVLSPISSQITGGS